MYVCKRCDYETYSKHNILAHLNTKKPCIANKLDIDRNVLIEEIKGMDRRKVERDQCICTTCNKVFITKTAFNKHLSHCAPSVQSQNDRIWHLEQEIDHLQKEKETMKYQLGDLTKRLEDLEDSKTQIANLKRIVDSMVRLNGSNTIENSTDSIINHGSIVNNVNLNITLRNFGDENMEALLDNEIGDCFLNLQFKDMVEQLHYNDEYPENKNVRIKSIKRKMMEIYESNKWNLTPFKEGLPKLVIQIQKIFEDYAKRNKEAIKDEMTKDELIANLEALNRIKRLDKNVINPIIKDLENLLEAKRS